MALSCAPGGNLGRGSDGGGAGGARPTIGMPRSSGGRGDDDSDLTIAGLGRVIASRKHGTDSDVESLGRRMEFMGLT
jgi:hypothetical protein